MSSNNIEDIFKHRFENFEEQPSADLFNRIQAKQKKNKMAIWWTAAVVGLLLVASGLFFLIPSKMEQPVAKTESAIEPSSTKTDLVSPEMSNKIEILDNEEEYVSAVPNTPKIKAQSAFPQNDEISVPLKVEAPKVDNEVVDRNLANKFNEILAEKGIKNPDKATIYIKDKMYDVGQRPKISPERNPNNAEDAKPAKNDLLDNQDKPQTPPLIDDIAKNSEEPNENDLPNNAHRANKWSLQIAGSPGYGTRFLSGSNNTVDTRNTTESNQLSYFAEVLGVYSFSEKWNAGVGISYQNRNEAFSMEKETIHQQTVINYDTFIVYQEPLPPRQVIISDTSYEFSSSVEALKHQNHYHILSIPLFAERIFYIENSNWTIFTQAGISAAVWQKSKGQIAEGDLDNLLELNTLNKNKIGINGVLLGAGVGYKLSDKVEVLF